MITEKAYGVIVVLREDEHKFLVLNQKDPQNDNWSFPKGHIEENEKPEVVALRELEEETGIKDIELLDLPLIHEEYSIVRNGENRWKVNEYFIGFAKKKKVEIQESEIVSYVWATYNEALQLFTQEGRKKVLKQAKEYLDKYGEGK